jgi:hypothetical protein
VLLERLRAVISPTLSWRTEVPLPNPGDQRAWDAMIVGHARSGGPTSDGPGTDAVGIRSFRVGIEAETRPRDAQALQRRLALKRREGGVDHVIVLLAATRGNRAFLREAWPALAADFPVSARDVIKALAAAGDPAGSAIVVM